MTSPDMTSPDMTSLPEPRTPAEAEEQRVFREEVGDAARYERGLAVKCACCLLLVALVLALRVYFFG